MGNFNSIEDFYSNLIKDLGVALKEALETAKQVAYDYIVTEWYQKYEPQVYERLGLMLESLQTEFKLNGNNLEAILYVRQDMHPASNSYNSNPISFDDLYEWFAEAYQSKDILEHTNEQMNDIHSFVNIIRDTLKSKGYNFE